MGTASLTYILHYFSHIPPSNQVQKWLLDISVVRMIYQLHALPYSDPTQRNKNAKIFITSLNTMMPPQIVFMSMCFIPIPTLNLRKVKSKVINVWLTVTFASNQWWYSSNNIPSNARSESNKINILYLGILSMGHKDKKPKKKIMAFPPYLGTFS